MRPTGSAHPVKLIPGLAASHLRHDWILTLCLVVALAAVIAPLLVLMGLKSGTIETLRERLVEDPVYREIRPAHTREFAPEWFEQVARWPGVDFLTPTILPLSSVVQVVHSQGGRVELFDLIPTGPGDPLLLENGARIPSEGQVVLSAEAARRMGVSAGDDLQVRVTRTRGTRTEEAREIFEVLSVLDARAGSLPRVYAPLDLVVDVEAFKEGYGASARGWPGDTPEPFLSFDGAILLLEEPLDPIARTGLIINTGFARLSDADPARVRDRIGVPVPAGLTAYDVFTPGSTVTVSNLRAIEQKLRGRQAVVLPYVDQVALTDDQDREIAVAGLSLSPRQAQLLEITAPPWGGFSGRAAPGDRLASVMLPTGMDAAGLGVVSPGVQTLRLSLEGVGTADGAHPVVPVELLGVLRTGMQRALTYRADTHTFEMARGGYRGFRLYARSIDDVPELAARLREQGLEFVAQVEAIERIQVLDEGLGRLFWLIALLGISGGTAVLVASLYAAVERLRRDLGVLRLLGLSRRHVFFFPVAQGLMMAGLGLVAALAGYASLAWAINRTFASELAPGERFCTLPGEQILMAIAATLALAVLASLVAAWRATRIDPAEAIREH
ncbi:FtsX-like permease family protein [Ectothiorhodospira variabilis]|uniref:ABC transporter permease n=1 Tax=Ectothiorhodospira variabilis TaxID=505694 RepID=UPI001EFA32D7|nr:FtsX-like permease family protein [Ectothiorhodospira variabilis]MCG5495601.1 FtsX-like permease family protein [Ectothiorhodospira variabilis]MCG5498361.1 FtsX-like permease family protein [Ectothiorhodospira variabilis]MCG5503069.1 FtsX-like permease family protein [Ectothiorhodospira variabilis]MCG5506172.1 FtsX-like permease family protein [Ectothiorhodospira variabilis]